MHELVEGVLQYMCAPYPHIQVLNHCRMNTLEQCLQETQQVVLLLLLLLLLNQETLHLSPVIKQNLQGFPVLAVHA